MPKVVTEKDGVVRDCGAASERWCSSKFEGGKFRTTRFIKPIEAQKGWLVCGKGGSIKRNYEEN